jgi:hypothetical protein
MRGWNDEAQWVTGDDGLRWYFSERNPGGPSRLECYRQLLAEPGDSRRGGYAPFSLTAYLAPLWRLTDVVARSTELIHPAHRPAGDCGQ